MSSIYYFQETRGFSLQVSSIGEASDATIYDEVETKSHVKFGELVIGQKVTGVQQDCKLTSPKIRCLPSRQAFAAVVVDDCKWVYFILQ